MGTIGQTFKTIREERQLNLEDVKERTGINKTLLSRIENGKRLPTKEQVIQLSKFYKVENDGLIIQWLSEKLVFGVQDEEAALEAIQVSEEKIKYSSTKKTNKEKHTVAISSVSEKKSIEEL